MPERPIITLLTDFGYRDSYVAEMKGVLLSICPTACLLDITHEIEPQNVAEAAFVLTQSCAAFPPRTVYLVVVDPGVGSARRAVAVETPIARFVAPDNGVLSRVLEGASEMRAVALNRPAYWRAGRPSSTFHGRDVFAPVAAHLANGVPLQAVGEPIGELTDLPAEGQPRRLPGRLEGHIIHRDHFGNLISDIPAAWLGGSRAWRVCIGCSEIAGVSATYAESEPGGLLALVGSHGNVEIAVNRGSVAERLGLSSGAAVILQAD